MMLKSKSRLTYNFASLGLAQAISSLLQLLVIPYIISRAGVANFGVIAVAQVVMYYMATFTDYGFNQTASREVSLNRDNTEALSSVFSRVYTVKVILCIAAFIILLLLSLFFSFIRENFWLYSMAFVFVPGYASIPGWFLQGVERMQPLALINLLSRIIFVALVFLFIKGPGQTNLFIFFFGLGNLLAGVGGIAFIKRKFYIKFRWPSSNEILSEFKRGWSVCITNLSMNVIQYGNLFILRLFTNDLVAGYFSVAERIYFTLKQVLMIFSQAVYPRVCQLAETAPAQLAVFFRKIFIPFFIVILAGSLGVLIFSQDILHFFMKENNEKSIFLLRMLCLVLPIVCLNIPSTLSLLAFDKRNSYFLIYTSAMVLNIICNIVMVPWLDQHGTLLAIFVTECFITIGVFIASTRYTRHKVGKAGVLNLQNEIQ